MDSTSIPSYYSRIGTLRRICKPLLWFASMIYIVNDYRLEPARDHRLNKIPKSAGEEQNGKAQEIPGSILDKAVGDEMNRAADCVAATTSADCPK